MKKLTLNPKPKLKPKPMKEFLGWSLVDEDGDVIAMSVMGGGFANVLDRCGDAVKQLPFERKPGDRIAHVLITEVR